MLDKDSHIFIGMQQDLSPTKHKPEHMCDAHNIRITSSDKEDTYLSLTNEKGTLKLNLKMNSVPYTIQGQYLGHCVIQLYNETLERDQDVIILFCTTIQDVEHPNSTPDTIYKITLETETVEILYNGNLNFSLEHPIESFFICEAIDINKVYWNDGYNQPRVINLNNVRAASNFDTQFDFIPTLDLEETVTITKRSLGGYFSPGVIQYALSYYNKWGQQSNIFYTSPLQYIAFDNRGGSPEEKIPNSFQITISNWQSGFDYIRIYSIHRTSLNATPECRIVQDIDLRELNGTITFIDDGQIGEFVDPSIFPYIGGQNIIAQTWDQKDNTLFLGNITLKTPSINEITLRVDDTDVTLAQYIRDNNNGILTSWSTGARPMNYTGFKTGEEYRFGFQAQYKDGTWSDPIWINDLTIATNVKPIKYVDADEISVPSVKCVLPELILNKLKNEGYKKVRGLCVFPNPSERNIIAQGIVSPSLITNVNSKNNVKNLSSWFFRPMVPADYVTYPVSTHGDSLIDEFNSVQLDTQYYVDYSKVSFYSPDVEFTDDLYSINNEKLILKLLGLIKFNDIQVDRQLSAASPAKLGDGGVIQDLDTDVVLGVPWWKDGIIKITSETEEDAETHELVKVNNKAKQVYYIIYPWQTSGPMNNDIETAAVPGTAVLKNKTLSILLDSNRGYVDCTLVNPNFEIFGQKVINNEEEVINIVENEDKTTFKYQCNFDTVLMSSSCRPYTTDYKRYLDPNDSQYFLNKEYAYEQLGGHYIGGHWKPEFLDYKGDFTSLKYKSGKHLILNLNNQLLPATSSSDAFVLNNNIINRACYYKLPAYDDAKYSIYGDAQASHIGGCVHYTGAFSDVNNGTDTLYLGSFRLLIARESISNSLPYYDQELMGFVKKYGKDPFPIIVDLSNFNIGDLPANHNKRFLGIATSCEFSNYHGEATLVYVDYSIGNHLTHTELVGKQLRVPYMVNGEKVVGYFDPSYYTAIPLINGWTEQTSGSGNGIIGFNVKYTSELQDISYSDNTVNPVLVNPNDYTLTNIIDKNNTDNCWNNIESDFVKNTLIAKVNQEIITVSEPETPKLFICDIYRDPTTINNKFGGTTQEAFKSNIWLPVSEAYNIDYLLQEPTEQISSSNVMMFERGDTWFQKYYCLKTYPYASTDENQIINKAGFYCETRHNLYGVYDVDKPSTQLFIKKDNFNKFNNVYDQEDNFFTYRILSKDFYERDNFPYSFMWTKEKVNTADIDNYNNLSLVSSLEANNKGGEITKLIVHNGSIYCFQPDGISRILYNSRVQIPVSDGVPIEIANSAKLEGVSNITNTIGCDNKWSVVSTNTGLFFIDNRRKGMFVIGDDGTPQNLSAQLNMSNWFSKQNLSEWKIASNGDWIGAKLCDDYVNNDIYLIKNSTLSNEGSLVFSKKLNQFTSFMSYGETDSIFNAGQYLYAFKVINNEVGLYKMNSGNYNYFFNQYEPFDFTFISSGNSQTGGPTIDKTFTNVELRASFANDKYFDYIQAKNDYQDTGVCNINRNTLVTGRHFQNGDTARKFRIWRTDIPRTVVNSRRTLDRIRNIWTKVKLGINRASAGNWKMELHDINVLYHI